MRAPTLAGLVLVSLLGFAPDRADSQGVGGLIKKKAAEAAKGKDKKDQAKEVAKDDGPIKSAMGDCGPLTPEKVGDFLRGLKTEQTTRDDFDSMFRGLRSHEQVVACRQQEVMGPEAQKIMMQGMGPNATTAQLQKAMEKNRQDLEKHMDKKCGKDPSQLNQRQAYDDARKAGAKAAGLSDDCYDKLKEFALAFCKLTPAEQKTATETGIKAAGQGKGQWVFTADEAKAFAPRCGELVPLIGALGYKL